MKRECKREGRDRGHSQEKSGIGHQFYMDQLTLPLLLNNAGELRDYLQRVSGMDISLTITENATSMLSSKIKDGIIHVRAHRIFLTADMDTLSEIAEFIRKRRGNKALIKRHIKQNRQHIEKKPPRKTRLDTTGRYYDLQSICEGVNREYFENRITALITWGLKNTRHIVRKRTLGSYNGHTNTIRISRTLDRKTVPFFFIKFVVYHEMLHADMAIEKAGSRRSVHSREFRRREKLFESYDKAAAWAG